MTIEEMCKVVEGAPEPIHCSLAAMRKFIKRLEKEQRLECMEEDAELVETMAKRGANSDVREATLATMRQRMFEAAFESNNRELLMETFGALNEEKDKERAAALEERRVKVQEEAAKIAWRKLESENARSGLKALPRIRELLMDTAKGLEERVSGALQILGQMEASVMPLPERTADAAAGTNDRPRVKEDGGTMVLANEQRLISDRAAMPMEMARVPTPALVSASAPLPRPLPERVRPMLTQPFVRGEKVGRNDPCPCGSGQKFKRCCDGKQAVPMRMAA